MDLDDRTVRRFSPVLMRVLDKGVDIYFNNRAKEVRKQNIEDMKEVYDKRAKQVREDVSEDEENEIEETTREVVKDNSPLMVRRDDSKVEKFRKYVKRFNQTENPKNLDKALKYADFIDCASCTDLLGKAYEHAQEGKIDTAKTEIIGVITYLSMYEE